MKTTANRQESMSSEYMVYDRENFTLDYGKYIRERKHSDSGYEDWCSDFGINDVNLF